MAEFPLLALRRRLCVEFAFEFALLLRLRLPVKLLFAELFISICSRDFRGLNSSVDILQDGAYFDPGNRKRFL